MASCADDTILLMAGRMVVVLKNRGVRACRRAVKRKWRCILTVVGILFLLFRASRQSSIRPGDGLLWKAQNFSSEN
jgi:hypothetical protein